MNPLAVHPIGLDYQLGNYAAQPHMVEVGYIVTSDILWPLEDEHLQPMIDWIKEFTGEKENSIFGAWSELRCNFSFRDKATAIAFKLRFA